MGHIRMLLQVSRFSFKLFHFLSIKTSVTFRIADFIIGSATSVKEKTRRYLVRKAVRGFLYTHPLQSNSIWCCEDPFHWKPLSPGQYWPLLKIHIWSKYQETNQMKWLYLILVRKSHQYVDIKWTVGYLHYVIEMPKGLHQIGVFTNVQMGNIGVIASFVFSNILLFPSLFVAYVVSKFESRYQLG